ncbi:hypothetical protein F4859DRAFT_518105 [Xylaria cf. heliscus]|nr:hypothetical protein F4859DRAFT_518105 [Xylaria cf. heliscus]
MASESRRVPLLQLHYDVAAKYHIHGPRLKQLWHGMEPDQRERAMKAGAPDGKVLKHSTDSSMGQFCNFLPEWNLKDIAGARSDSFLHLLEQRATKSLQQQYRTGDYEHISNMMRTGNLELVEFFEDCYTLFMDGVIYGFSFNFLDQNQDTIAKLQSAIGAGLCIPKSVGQLVILRQASFLHILNDMVNEVLAVSSTTRTENERQKMSSNAVTIALSKLSITPSMPDFDLSSVQDMALDQKASVNDNVTLLFTEPVVLSHLVHNWFFSRPELVSDEGGIAKPVYTDKLISGAFLDTVHHAVRGAAIWNYLCQLLELLKTTTDTSCRQSILREIFNVCHLEYSRVQAMFKRQMSMKFSSLYFKRVSSTYDNGNRVVLISEPEVLAGVDNQLHYLLRLCQEELTAPQAVDCLKKLEELQRNNPSVRDDLNEAVIDALNDLAISVAFIESLSQAVPIPAFNRRGGRLFVTGAAELEIKLNQIKLELDLSSFVNPIGNLLEPGKAEAALKAFDAFMINKTGTKMGLLYPDLIDNCMKKLQKQLAVQAERQAVNKAVTEIKSEYIPFPPEAPKAPEDLVAERRKKEKTRPAHSSVHNTSSPDLEAVAATPDPLPPPEPLKVKSATAEVFSTLFDRTESRGSIPWASFEAALAELNFSVIPKFGSVYTFFPPKSMAIQKPLTLHRPHKSRIEGQKLLVFAHRLNELYGWGKDTFQVA